MDEKRFLPTGSVVLLKEATKRLMICGRKQIDTDSNETFDYSACLYPEGVIDSENLFLFNGDQIEKVFYIGFQDEEELDYAQYLKTYKEMPEMQTAQ